MNILGKVYVGLRDRVRRESGTPTERQRFLAESTAGGGKTVEQRLSDILQFAASNVPYYRKVAAELGDRASSLENWPVLTKAIIREQGAGVHADDGKPRDISENTSGGSTGKPVRFLHDEIFRERAAATRSYHMEHVMGLSPNMSQVVLWGSERDIFENKGAVAAPLKTRAKSWLLQKMDLQTTVLNAFRMSVDDVDRYLGVINGQKPQIIQSYAGSLYQLAKQAKDKNLRMHSPYRIYTTAETLRPFMREVIEDVFKTHVYDFYGSREVGPIAGEGPGGNMFTFDFFNYVEVVDENNRPVEPGQQGRVLITTLHNHVMPFIRYEIGDMAIRGLTSSALGRPLNTLEKVTGRITDQFLTESGTLVHGEYFTHLFYFADWVDEFQVTQTAVNSITISYVPLSEPPAAAVSDIESKVRLVMGDACEILWERVAQVPRTREGKLLFTRSLITQPPPSAVA